MPIPQRNNVEASNNSTNVELEESINQRSLITGDPHAHGNNSVEAVIEEVELTEGLVEAAATAPNNHEHTVKKANSIHIQEVQALKVDQILGLAPLAPLEMTTTAQSQSTVAIPIESELKAHEMSDLALGQEMRRPKGIMAKIKSMLKMTESAELVNKNTCATTGLPKNGHNNNKRGSQEH